MAWVRYMAIDLKPCVPSSSSKEGVDGGLAQDGQAVHIGKMHKVVSLPTPQCEI